MKRAIIVVIDSMGIGAMPDHEEFNDVKECNTLKNVCAFNKGIKAPNMAKLGLGKIQEFEGIEAVAEPIGQYGTMQEKSKGKDTTTGHWEITGLVSEHPFATFPNGFPQELLEKFINETNCGGILGNIPASGTAIIEELNDEHQKTKFPIIYTSADSVYQIAVDTDVIPLETLYDWCVIARRLLDKGNYHVSRVIARPYKVIDGKPTRIGKDRRDYSVEPTGETLLDRVKNSGGEVVGIGKIEDIFSKAGITHAIHTGSNKEGLDLTLKAIKNELDLKSIKYASIPDFTPNKSIIFTNLVDTDMLFGHRNDAEGYGKAIEEIDTYVSQFIDNMSDDDLLVITADHGCDPTVKGTDHTREYVPVLYYHKNIEPKDLGLVYGFDSIAKTVEEWLKNS